MIFVQVQPVTCLGTFAGHAWSDHLAQAIDIDGSDAESRFDVEPHRFGPWLRSEDTEAQLQVIEHDPLALEDLADDKGIRRRATQYVGAQVTHDHDLAQRVAT